MLLLEGQGSLHLGIRSEIAKEINFPFVRRTSRCCCISAASSCPSMLSAKWQKEKLDYKTGARYADSKSDGTSYCSCNVTSQNGFSIQENFQNCTNVQCTWSAWQSQICNPYPCFCIHKREVRVQVQRLFRKLIIEQCISSTLAK